MIKTFTQLVLVSLIGLLIIQNSYGQKNFTKGYVILPSRDTLQGLIDDQNWDRNPTHINFKKNDNGEPQSYQVNQIEGFGITNGDVYLKSIVKIDKTPTRFDELVRNPKPVEAIDTVFLLQLAKGKINLFHLNEESHRSHFFIQRENEPIVELVQRNYLANKNGQQMLGTSEQYKDQLRYSYLTECADIEFQIIKATYTKLALKSIVEKYNECINPSIKAIEVSVTKPIEFRYQITAGVNNTLYFFKGKETRYVDDMTYKSKFNPMIGLSFQIIIPRNRQKWSIYNELAWKRSYTNGTYQHTDRWIDEKSSISIKANYIGLTSLIRYSWMNKKYQPFINAGFAINRAVSLDMHLKTYKEFYTYHTSYDGPYQENHRRNVEIGVVSGAGIKIKNIAAEIRYERANGFLDLSHLSIEKKMLMFLVSYYLN